MYQSYKYHLLQYFLKGFKWSDLPPEFPHYISHCNHTWQLNIETNHISEYGVTKFLCWVKTFFDVSFSKIINIFDKNLAIKFEKNSAKETTCHKIFMQSSGNVQNKYILTQIIKSQAYSTSSMRSNAGVKCLE